MIAFEISKPNTQDDDSTRQAQQLDR